MSDPAPPRPGVTPLRVLIVDDQPLVRQGLALLLDLEDDVEVVGQAEDGLEALHLAQQLRPDVVLMDVRMPVIDGVRATEEFHRRGGPPVVLLTTFEEVEDMAGGLNAGAAGYLFKSAEIEEILEALHRVHRGEQAIHPRVAQVLARQLQSPAPSLTEREQEVLRGLAAGQTNKQIAEQMGISEGTVKVHVSNILAKLGAGNRTEAVLLAGELELL
ncbi:response regulator transcription factor [Deinococcus sp. DB0503]|uniref:response regulator n=1 Tax=Deinococcus sp. DB0503 TaxID=2479203 RepID=UPI0018E01E28|nr:response regulator transcription factor [Deinococcus sp. DB0503]MBI0446900.1 DNA-binding response regulator [Deinococcus sp. DB0503]